MVLYKNIRARSHLDIFLIAAGTGVLLVRFYLHITGYPQLGGGGLHIAHMLWGGLLMMVGMVGMLAFLGMRVQRFGALVGGLGFGIFIDEIGKFITSDNNYFYQPAIGIIYAILAVMYLAFGFLARKNQLSSREYQMNALAELEEAVSHDMDEAEKARAIAMLAQADQGSHITRELHKLFVGLATVPRPPKGWVARLMATVNKQYQNFWRQRQSRTLVRLFFIAEAVIIIAVVIATFATNIDDLLRAVSGNSNYATWLLVGELTAAFVASLIVVRGAIALRRSRLDAFELFRLATLINLLLTEFFRFARLEFAALPSFVINLVLITLISYAIQQERQLGRKT